MSATPLSTLNPCLSSSDERSCEVLYSWRPTSAYSQALSLIPIILFSFSSIQLRAISFNI
jgi:hypothetical protein